MGLGKRDVLFTYDVLNDTKKLDLSDLQIQRRERAVNAVLGDQAKACGIASDPLFRKKNWNPINSGFHLWGSGEDFFSNIEGQSSSSSNNDNSESNDDFLESKNWNAIDSGFKLF